MRVILKVATKLQIKRRPVVGVKNTERSGRRQKCVIH